MDPRVPVVAVSAVAVLGGAFLAWRLMASRLRYVIGRDSFRVMLGGLTVRRILFEDIERVRKPRRELRWTETENWRTTWLDHHRLLILERRSGWFRKFVITPRRRYEMRAQLREAIAKSTGRATEAGDPDTDLDEETDASTDTGLLNH